MCYETLTDLLNNDPAAYEYFYALPPEMQTALQQHGGIRSLSQPLRSGGRPPPMNRSSAAPARFEGTKKTAYAVFFCVLSGFLVDLMQQPDDLGEPQQHGSGYKCTQHDSQAIIGSADAVHHGEQDDAAADRQDGQYLYQYRDRIFVAHSLSPFVNIPNRDIYIIPVWDNKSRGEWV